MADGSENDSDMEAIAWPGFVDILSAVIIMFVFFVMVIVIVLYIYTIKFTSTIEAEAEQRIQETIEKIEKPDNIEELEKEKAQAIKDIKDLNEKKQQIEDTVRELEKDVKQLSVGFSNDGVQEITIEDTELTVLFDDSSITLREDVIEQIEEFIQSIDKNKKILIEAGDASEAISQSNSRQLSLARMLNIRNVLLSQEYESANISVNYAPAAQVLGNYNWVRLRVE